MSLVRLVDRCPLSMSHFDWTRPRQGLQLVIRRVAGSQISQIFRRASAGSEALPSLARWVSMQQHAKLPCRGSKCFAARERTQRRCGPGVRRAPAERQEVALDDSRKDSREHRPAKSFSDAIGQGGVEIVKESSGNDLNVSAIAVVCYTIVFGFGPDDPHECQGMRLTYACVQSHISKYRISDSTFSLFPDDALGPPAGVQTRSQTPSATRARSEVSFSGSAVAPLTSITE